MKNDLIYHPLSLTQHATGSIVYGVPVAGVKATGQVSVVDYMKAIGLKAAGTIEVLDYTKAVGVKASGGISVIDYTKADGLKAARDITVVDYTKAIIATAAGSVTVADYLKCILTAATGTIEITDYTQLAGKTITVAGHVMTENVDFEAVTDNATTAISLMAAIGMLTEVNADRTGAVITITAATAGAAGNSLGLATNASGGITLSGANLTGGYDNAVVTVAGHALTQGTDWTAATDNDTTATSLASAISALTEVNATATLAVIAVTAAAGGTAGNSVGLVTSSSAAVSVSGANLTGGQDNCTITVDGQALVQGTNWTAETNNDTTAENLKVAIHALTNVNATRSGAVITVEAAAIGAAGNSIGTTTSDATAVSVAGAQLTGGQDPLTITVGGVAFVEGTDFNAETSNEVTAENIKLAIDGHADYEASRTGAAITVNFITDGVAGNAKNLLTSAISAATVTGATLTGGQDPLVLTVGTNVLTEGVDFNAVTDNATTAENIKVAVNALGDFDATRTDAVVSAEYSTIGVAGNGKALTQSGGAVGGGAVTLSGSSFANGREHAVVTVNGTALTQGSEWTASVDNATTAESLKTAIDGLASLGAARSGSNINITADAEGTAGNGITLATSYAAAVSVSGANLTGGVNGDTVEVHSTVFTCVTSSPGAGEFTTIAELTALIAAISGVGATSDGTTISITADAPGTGGNAYTLALGGSNAGTMSVSGSGTLSGGVAATYSDAFQLDENVEQLDVAVNVETLTGSGAGAKIYIQDSPDASNWSDLDASVTMSAAGTSRFTVMNPDRYVRYKLVLSGTTPPTCSARLVANPSKGSETQSSNEYAAVTPDAEFARPCRGIYCGGSGDIVAVDFNGHSVTFKNVPVGVVLPIKATKVTSGSSATLMVALF